MSPDDVRCLREQVGAADRVLRDEAAKLAGHTIVAEWRPAGPGPRANGPVTDLDLRLESAHLTVPISGEELDSPERLRRRLRRELWSLVTTYATSVSDRIARLADQITHELSVAEA